MLSRFLSRVSSSCSRASIERWPPTTLSSIHFHRVGRRTISTDAARETILEIAGRSFEAVLFGATCGILVGGGVAYYLSKDPLKKTHASESLPLPGGDLKLDSYALCAGEKWMQDLTPVRHIHQTVCGLHFYDGEPDRQVIAHHFCNHVNEDFRQCVIYDSDSKDAKLIGIEYIISRKLFEELPDEEKKYWHSHVSEVTSGILVAPGAPELAERLEMTKLIDTYGKTWHTWQVDAGHSLPLGPPRLMLAPEEGQVNRALLEEKDRRTRISTEDRKAKRANIPRPDTIASGADQGFHPALNRHRKVQSS